MPSDKDNMSLVSELSDFTQISCGERTIIPSHIKDEKSNSHQTNNIQDSKLSHELLDELEQIYDDDDEDYEDVSSLKKRKFAKTKQIGILEKKSNLLIKTICESKNPSQEFIKQEILKTLSSLKSNDATALYLKLISISSSINRCNTHRVSSYKNLSKEDCDNLNNMSKQQVYTELQNINQQLKRLIELKKAFEFVYYCQENLNDIKNIASILNNMIIEGVFN